VGGGGGGGGGRSTDVHQLEALLHIIGNHHHGLTIPPTSVIFGLHPELYLNAVFCVLVCSVALT